MNAGKALYYILTNSDVNTSLSGRIYPSIAPFDAITPFIVYNYEGNVPYDTKSGVSTLDEATYELIVVCDSYSTLATISQGVRTALDRYSGDANGVTVQSIQYITEETDHDRENERYMVAQDYKIRIKL